MLRNSLRLFAGAMMIGLTLLVSGCDFSYMSTMDPVGPIGETERDITLLTILLMAFVFIPILGMTIAIAWRYRSTSTNSKYTPDWDHSWLVELFAWGGPIIILIILAVMILGIQVTGLAPFNLSPSAAFLYALGFSSMPLALILHFGVGFVGAAMLYLLFGRGINPLNGIGLALV